MNNKNAIISCVILIALLFGMIYLIAYRKFQYKILIANFGSHGVIIRSLPVVEGDGEIPKTSWVSPSLAVPDGFHPFDHFIGHLHSLPETLMVTWQLAELSDCDYVYKNAGHIDKLGCTWAPIKGKIFHQRIDMAAIRASEAYRRVGERVKDTVSGYVPFARYKLVIEFIFNEDKLVVKTSNTYETGI